MSGAASAASRRSAGRILAVTGFEQRQPGPGEGVGLTEAGLAGAELEQKVDVGVGDHTVQSATRVGGDSFSLSPGFDVGVAATQETG